MYASESNISLKIQIHNDCETGRFVLVPILQCQCCLWTSVHKFQFKLQIRIEQYRSVQCLFCMWRSIQQLHSKKSNNWHGHHLFSHFPYKSYQSHVYSFYSIINSSAAHHLSCPPPQCPGIIMYCINLQYYILIILSWVLY